MPDKVPKYPFQHHREDHATALLIDWWKDLENDRGARANLRRAGNPDDVVFVPAFHRLLNRLRNEGFTIYPPALAAVCGLASHIKPGQEGGDPMPVRMATPKAKDGNARVSGLRFRRLLAIDNRDRMYPSTIRVIRLLDGAANLADLARDIYHWNTHVRKQWAYAYYATAPAEV